VKFTLSSEVTITIFSVPAHLPIVRAAVEKCCELAGFGNEAAGEVVLSVDEALTNIIKHAYDGAHDKKIEIELDILGREVPAGLEVRIRDYGRHASPEEIKSRDLDEIRPGGLGVHIMNKCMDRVVFEPVEGGGTLLTMTKTLSPGQENTGDGQRDG